MDRGSGGTGVKGAGVDGAVGVLKGAGSGGRGDGDRG